MSCAPPAISAASLLPLLVVTVLLSGCSPVANGSPVDVGKSSGAESRSTTPAASVVASSTASDSVAPASSGSQPAVDRRPLRDPGIDTLPTGAYHGSRYRDARRDLHTWSLYYDDGRIERFDGRGWRLACRLSPAEVSEAKLHIQQSGVFTAPDVKAGKTYDAAKITYLFRIGGRVQEVRNRSYPAVRHPAMDALNAKLYSLEQRRCPEPPEEPAKGPGVKPKRVFEM